MAILLGLFVSLLGATAIACAVLGLSNLYVGQWAMAFSLVGAAVVLGFAFAGGWRFFQAETSREVEEVTAISALPRTPSLLAGFWLCAIALVLATGAWTETGVARWLSGGTAGCLVIAGAIIVLFRPAE